VSGTRAQLPGNALFSNKHNAVCQYNRNLNRHVVEMTRYMPCKHVHIHSALNRGVHSHGACTRPARSTTMTQRSPRKKQQRTACRSPRHIAASRPPRAPWNGKSRGGSRAPAPRFRGRGRPSSRCCRRCRPRSATSARAMDLIARHLMVSPVTLEGVASFYAQFRFEKPGRQRSPSAAGRLPRPRSGRLLDEVSASLGAPPGSPPLTESSRSRPSPASARARSPGGSDRRHRQRTGEHRVVEDAREPYQGAERRAAPRRAGA